MTDQPRFLAACRGLPVDRPPVWLMRQAGRYLPEYQEVRARAGDFLTLCHTADMAIEVTLQPIRRFGFDAAILFSDILVPAEAMGATVVFAAGEGPRIEDPVRSARDLERLRCPEPEEACPYVFEAVRGLRRALGDTPLVGFAAAPWTLMAYLVEGHASREFGVAKRMLLAEPDLARALLGKIADYTVAHLTAQVRAGAQALQLFDTWAELLTPGDYAAWALAVARDVLQRVRAAVGPDVPLVYFSKGTAGHLPLLREVPSDVVSVDWRIDLPTVRAALGEARPLQGNLDPIVLLAGPDVTRARARIVLDALGGRAHVFNLGHGILPTTPIPSVEALVETVRGWRPS
ncbi:MAG: uroporphyrinogen decarboxylase [Planctomycetota bacterium]|nr:uroporphyrinogen decarboxylase [Planctomycetota bacterium]